MSAPVDQLAADKALRQPPIWLAGAATASGWAAVFSFKSWIDHYLQDPAADDFRIYYYAAKLGLERGWDQIYNQAALRAVMALHFSGSEAAVDAGHTYPNPPPLAWLIAPLTALSFGPAYAAWAGIGLVTLLVAWWVACPFRGFARLTLLLLAVAIWPVHYSLVFGQPTPEILALTAAAWWLMRRDRAAMAGIALALATSLKPQDVILVPLALLASGRVRVFISWGVGCFALGLICFALLGVDGVAAFWQTNIEVEGYAGHKIMTLASVLGPGLPAAALQVGSAATALIVAWRRRANLELVTALGLLGSVVSAVHAHESDFSVLVLAAWLVLRSPAGLASRAWLLAGIAAVQTMAIGWALPTLLWELAWLLLLAADRMAPAPTTESVPEPTSTPTLAR
jgi:hypothetical protein